ncbi:MAG TPA: class I tRNA ligase family protein, partial [Candidatus Saccharimonadales bacterium]|nr:class I tRNA ligase family protein [Candidatus Saccharimonadales bacterium]
RGEGAHKVWHADYVSSEDGSGIVHLAPAYGEEDFVLAQEKKIPVIHVIDENGLYTEGDWTGENVWEANKPIAKALLERGVVWKIEYIRHSYPHCHRCGTRLMYRAHPSWFMDIDGQREKMLVENTENVTWFPEHIKHGRFEKTVEQAPDWNLSRDRFWATAMPVWEGVDSKGKKHQKVIGSYAELKEFSGKELDDYHRPWVDDIEFDLDGVHYTRVEKVLDCWFESGSMPFAQFHYPFENVEKFESNFPGDFITEYVGQVRAWFYYVHAVNVGLFGKNAFKNVIVTGNLAGNDGRKMSKSYGNYTDPNVLMDEYSADSLRFLLLSSPLMSAEDFALQDKEVGDVARKLSMVWNMYDFFTMYAEVDGWEFKGDLSDPSQSLENPLDQWIVSRVHQLNLEVQEYMNKYDVASAVKPILPFIEDASNWYVRRSRRRFWKSGDDTDKNNAYRTLHYVLVQLAQIMAPFTPFLAEELYQKLTGGESVHLLDWPKAGHVNELVVNEMETVRDYVNQGLSIRAKERLKVRQPLASVTVPTLGQFVNFEDILTEELNVKEVKTGEELALDLEVTPELKREGLMREVVRHVQNARKQAGLNVDDRIKLSLVTGEAELKKAIATYEETIAAETLAETLTEAEYDYSVDLKVEGMPVKVSLQKA